MLVVSQQICLKYDLVNTRFQTDVNLSIDLNQNFVFRLSSCLKLKYKAQSNMNDSDTVYFQFLFLSRDDSRLVQVPEGLTQKNHSDCWSTRGTGQNFSFVTQPTVSNHSFIHL